MWRRYFYVRTVVNPGKNLRGSRFYVKNLLRQIHRFA